MTGIFLSCLGVYTVGSVDVNMPGIRVFILGTICFMFALLPLVNEPSLTNAVGTVCRFRFGRRYAAAPWLQTPFRWECFNYMNVSNRVWKKKNKLFRRQFAIVFLRFLCNILCILVFLLGWLRY